MTGPQLFLKRRRLKVNQDEVAARLGLYVETVRDIEGDLLPLTESFLQRMENVIDEMATEKNQAREEVSAAA